jgi:uncharacterized membrane protein
VCVFFFVVFIVVVVVVVVVVVAVVVVVYRSRHLLYHFRYRLNTDQIQGEVYSYYLAQLLNMTRYMPPAIMVPVDTLSAQWRPVHLQVSMAQWADGRIVVLTK